MTAAMTPAELDSAIRAPFSQSFRGPTWSRICKARIEAGRRICASDPKGRFVPAFGPQRNLTVCGETYRVGRGQNSAGARYVWHSAQEWATSVLRRHGFTQRAAYGIWSTAFDYPHRALAVVEDALAGKLPDPRFNRLVYTGRSLAGRPVHVNRRTEARLRAHRPCKCGGMLWDWGAGWNGYANFISWRCDRCTRTFEMYVTNDGLSQIRSLKAAA